MSTTVAAIRGTIGNTDYYAAKVRAGELVRSVREPSDLDDWATMSIEERMQRDPNKKRIMDEIAPYIANTKERFFGAFVVLIYQGDVVFEPLPVLNIHVPQAYNKAAHDLGFLTIDDATLIVLDGQHRLLAYEMVTKNKIIGQEASTADSDEVVVIFIHHEYSKKTRMIFNKINRYAKPTSRGDNIITSEDDGYAIVTRKLLELDSDAPFGKTVPSQKKDGKMELIVDWKSNTLAPRSIKISTIAALYDTVKTILSHNDVPNLATQERPDQDLLDHCEQLVAEFWHKVLEGIVAYRIAMKDPQRMPGFRADDSKWSLLFKPAGQIAFIRAVTIAMSHGLALQEVLRRANLVNWSMRADQWRDIIVRPNGTIDTRAEAVEHAADLMAYILAGADAYTNEQVTDVTTMFNSSRGYNYEEPKPGTSPEPLPTPVDPSQAVESRFAGAEAL